MARTPLTAVVGRLFALDDPWERPAPTRAERRSDLWLAVGFCATSLVGQELMRGLGWFDSLPAGSPNIALQIAAIATGTLLLAWRRRWPLRVMALAAAHMIVVGVSIPGISYQVTMQLTYFFAFYSGVAFARDRRALALTVGGVLLAMAAWLALDFAVGNSIDSLVPREGVSEPALFTPLVSGVLYSLLVNVIYFGGAIWLGQNAWRSARDRDHLHAQAATIAGQAAQLRDQAVIDERLRIARELHDVVAHHVSVMGVQAAAARRQLTRDPELTATALSSVEASSREAVAQMRGLLGTLRSPGGEERTTGATHPTPAAQPGASALPGTAPTGDVAAAGGPAAPARSPQPGIPDVAQLVADVTQTGLDVSYQLVTSGPDAIDQVPPEIGLSVYRIVQEALANVSRHSTATSARVSVRVTGDYVEAEILDDGRPRGGTAGTGLGTLGIRERLASHGGTSEIGPRVTGGYRVRVRFPLARRSGDRVGDQAGDAVARATR